MILVLMCLFQLGAYEMNLVFPFVIMSWNLLATRFPLTVISDMEAIGSPALSHIMF